MSTVLDKRCRVEYKVTAVDPDYGPQLSSWALLGMRYCNFRDELPSRSEAVKQGLAMNTNRARVRFNYCTDIDTSMRIVINRPTPKIYQLIAGPAEVGTKRHIEFMAELYTTAGDGI